MKRYKKQANETGDDDIDRGIMNDRLKGFPSRATPDIGLLSKTHRDFKWLPHTIHWTGSFDHQTLNKFKLEFYLISF